MSRCARFEGIGELASGGRIVALILGPASFAIDNGSDLVSGAFGLLVLMLGVGPWRDGARHWDAGSRALDTAISRTKNWKGNLLFVIFYLLFVSYQSSCDIGRCREESVWERREGNGET